MPFLLCFYKKNIILYKKKYKSEPKIETKYKKNTKKM